MSVAPVPGRLQLPESLRTQLDDFRRRVWAVKSAEAACAAAFGVVVAFLLMFGLDRVWETPFGARMALFVAAAVGCAYAPYALHRWVWQRRRPDQLARLLTVTHPRIGDQLLGVIELVRNDQEQARSRELCEAAVAQVAEDAAQRDFSDAVPTPRHRLWAGLVAPLAVAALTLCALYPVAAANAWARLLAPWKAVPRYNFAAVSAWPARLVVPHGEAFTLTSTLQPGAVWKPARGDIQIGDRTRIVAGRKEGAYSFEVPAQIEPVWLSLRIGDARQRVLIDPTLRPELTGVVADVRLPAYLNRPKAEHKDARGGSVSVVKGSEAAFSATASRDLADASVDGRRRAPNGATVVSPLARVDGPRTVEFSWRDKFGLSGKEPFRLNVNDRDDEAPTLSCEDLPRQKVVLDVEQLSFKVRAQDDFGVKRVGLEWLGAADAMLKNPAKGERVLAAGGAEKESIELTGSFSAKSLGIEPQQIHLRVFAEDYLPGRPRVYSPTYTLYVLNAEQHAIWLTEQLSKWHKQSLEVRDRELQLHSTNQQLRALPSGDLDRPENRKRIENQANAERANGRRLTGLVGSGEDLVRQAMRNPEFGVGHLEKWAEMLQILKDVAANRMPSVADLLKQAAQSPTLAVNPPSNTGPTAGKLGSGGSAKPGETAEAPKKPPTQVPQIVDRESSQQPPGKPSESKKDDSPSKPKTPRLSLPQTTLNGTPKDAKNPPPETPAEQSVDQALKAQQDLLAEFDKIAEELNKVLANLEGSTLVKRLKAAARLQNKIAGRIGDQVTDAFGVEAPKLTGRPVQVLDELAEQEGKQGQVVSFIMDDLQSYFERRQYMRFKTVLDAMKKDDVIGGLRQVGGDLKKENGVSMALCEFWSDSLDRWAEDLVDPTGSGKCPGSKSKSSLPPSLVLEVLQILEGEINLREETRVAEQARPALESSEHHKRADGLSTTQKVLDKRVKTVVDKIRELPDGDAEFAYEINLLGEVSDVMADATEILARPETGRPAIAAETDAIELLLKSKRINPKGGGGGPTPGGGGTGATRDSALALVGGGVNAKETREDHGVSQTTGDSGPSLPEEFRAGLDEYFNRLERRPSGQ